MQEMIATLSRSRRFARRSHHTSADVARRTIRSRTAVSARFSCESSRRRDVRRARRRRRRRSATGAAADLAATHARRRVDSTPGPAANAKTPPASADAVFGATATTAATARGVNAAAAAACGANRATRNAAAAAGKLTRRSAESPCGNPAAIFANFRKCSAPACAAARTLNATAGRYCSPHRAHAHVANRATSAPTRASCEDLVTPGSGAEPAVTAAMSRSAASAPDAATATAARRCSFAGVRAAERWSASESSDVAAPSSSPPRRRRRRRRRARRR